MQENFYTHALWHVKEGKIEEYIARSNETLSTSYTGKL
jgi:hypothetical protein